MRKKALVVVQKDECFDHIDEVFFSLDHIYDHACCQEEARWLLSISRYDYILADLLMSVRWLGQRRVATCLNFLGEVDTAYTDRRIPIILVVDRLTEPALISVEAIVTFASNIKKAKVIDFVEKPFPTAGRTLDSVIGGVLSHEKEQESSPMPGKIVEHPAWAGNQFRGAMAWQAPGDRTKWLGANQRGTSVASPSSTLPNPVETKMPKTFTGGELVIYPDHAELLGVKIIGNGGTGQSLMILEVLSEKHPSGRYRCFSGAEIIKRIGADGIGTITSCVKTLRTNISERLLERLGVACGPEDVIENDGKQGYCLRDWIAVKFVQRKAPVAHADDEQTPGARRKCILAALTKRAMKLPDLTSVLRVSAKTVARTLNELRADGLVEFVGSRKTGQYQVKG